MLKTLALSLFVLLALFPAREARAYPHLIIGPQIGVSSLTSGELGLELQVEAKDFHLRLLPELQLLGDGVIWNATAGYAFQKHNGTGGAAIVDDQTSTVSGNIRTTTTEFHGDATIPSQERLIVEVGLISAKGTMNRVVEQQKVTFSRRVTTFALGLRRAKFLTNGSASSLDEYWIHLLVQGPGRPDGSFSGDYFHGLPVGLTVGMSYNIFLNSLAPIQAEIGYFPGVGLFVSLGASITFHFFQWA